MSSEPLNYPRMLQTALRALVRDALAVVEEEGMPGDHHFYIQFSTQHPLLRMPAFLRDQFPQDMTIILQHQYWDLVVEEDEFSVVLSFGGVRHGLTIPFDAVVSFADPSVHFALAIDDRGRNAIEKQPERPAEKPSEARATGRGAEVVKLDAFRKPRS
ncbi:MAG: hypothetical protein KDD47_10890 [Acidobacteria bacterium]|nr:hypothetical protein [Acidobacteriota bacterium]